MMKNIYVAGLALALMVCPGVRIIMSQNLAPGASSKLETEIGKVIRGYYEAFKRRDGAATSAVYADDGFAYSLESGYESNKLVKEEVSAFLRSPLAAASKDTYEIEDLKVLAVTADTAMANYTVITTTEKNGAVDVRRDRTTNVFARRQGRWQIVADHTSRLPDTASSKGLPIGWKSNNTKGYSITLDTNVKHGGAASAAIRFTCGGEIGYDSFSQYFAADDYRGKRIRLSGWLKSDNVNLAGLWMRIDGDRRLLGFDNMMDRPVTGTTEWKRYEIVLDIPAEAVNIHLGTIVNGKGQVWVDDLKLEFVGSEVPTTNQLSAERMRADDPSRNEKRSEIKTPVNLSFEDGVIP